METQLPHRLIFFTLSPAFPNCFHYTWRRKVTHFHLNSQVPSASADDIVGVALNFLAFAIMVTASFSNIHAGSIERLFLLWLWAPLTGSNPFLSLFEELFWLFLHIFRPVGMTWSDCQIPAEYIRAFTPRKESKNSINWPCESSYL